MIEDDISKWELTGLVTGSEGNAKYITSKLLNIAALKITDLISNKRINPSSRFMHTSLPVVSAVGKAIGGHSKTEFFETGYFEDNTDIFIHPRIHALVTPVLNKTDDYGFLAMEEDHIYEVSKEIIDIFKNILEDDTVATLYVQDVFIPYLEDSNCASYATSYAIYRKGN